MILYRLICARSHEFESWFRSSEDFDKQVESHLLECPLCGDKQIEKALMAPNVTNTKKKGDKPQPIPGPQLDERMVKVVKDMRRHIHANADNVGDKFPEEARKMHYGEIDQRAIYGEAAIKEVKELVDEGIDVMPLPELPEDKH